MVNIYVPAVPTAGVPAKVAVPLPLSTKVTPLGSVAPPSDKLGIGDPVAVTVNDPAEPSVKVVEFGLVICGGVPGLTVRMKFWVTGDPTPFVAVMVNG